MRIHTRALWLSIAALTVGLSSISTAQADRYYRPYRPHSHYGYGLHYYDGPYYGPRLGLSYHYRGSDGDVAAGILAGALLGWALTSSYYNRPSYSPPPSYPAVPPRTSTPPPARQYQPAYDLPPPPAGATCLQTREYQMTVTVGGESVEAYGTACLQPDGSWLRGPARIADYD